MSLGRAVDPFSDAILSKLAVRVTRVPVKVPGPVTIDAIISLRVIVSLHTTSRIDFVDFVIRVRFTHRGKTLRRGWF